MTELLRRFQPADPRAAEALRNALLLAAAVAVLPLLPQEPVDPWNVIFPAKLWRLVVLILAVETAGHVAQRLVGARWGLPLTGFLAGFASSTAAVLGFGQRASQEPAHVDPAASGALFANLGSLVLFAGVVGAAAPDLLRLTALPLVLAGVLLAVLGFNGVFRHEQLSRMPGNGNGGGFRFRHALMLVGLIALLLVVSALLRERFGSAGVLFAAATVAAVELQASAVTVAELSSVGALSIPSAAWGLVLLILVAGVIKTSIAFASGGSAYGWRVAIGLLGMPVVMAVALWLGPYGP